MKILVTGGAGFIGSHIVDKYLSKGHEVHIIDDMSSGKTENINEKAVFHKLDIGSDEAAALIAKERFDVINHHAAQMDVRRSVADPAFDARVNILGSINLLEAGVKNGLKKFIFASSGGTVYGEQDYFPADESHPLRPLSPYGIAKATVEKYMFFYQETYGIKQVSLRYANVYGPRQNPHGEAGVVAIFAKKILHGEQPVINGDGEQTRDYVFIEDVVKANLLALEKSRSGSFNVGTGEETDVNEIFQTVNSYFGEPCEEKHGEAKAGEQKRSVLDNTLIKDKLGWIPDYDFESGMDKTLAWFKAEYDKTHA